MGSGVTKMQFTLKRMITTFICMLVMLGNAQVSQAEVRTYEGVGEYIMSDFETPDIAKQRAKARAEQHVAEQAGVYVKSYTRTVNHTLVEDEIVAIANMIIKIVDVQYTTNPTSEAGGTLQIVARIRATVDSERIDQWLKRDQSKIWELVERNKQLQADKAKLDEELTELRQKLTKVTNVQEKQNLEKKMVSTDSKFLANQKIKEGWRLYNDGKYIEAVAMFSQAVVVDENSSVAYYSRGVAYDSQGNYIQAIEDYTKAIAINPNYEDAYNNRGVTYSRQGNYTQAIADFNKSILLNPKNFEVYYNRGMVYDKQGNYTQAIDDFNKSIMINPNFFGVYNNRGNVHSRQGDYTQAITDYNKAIDINPNDAYVYNNRGVAYVKQGNYSQAILDFNKAIAINPNFAMAYFSRGNVYGEQGNYTQAIADFTKVIGPLIQTTQKHIIIVV